MILKDPDAVLDFGIDWSAWLADGETIAASTWTLPDGITEATPAPSHTDTAATVWLSGGTAGTNYRVTNHITTSAGRQDDRSLTIHVTNR